MAKEKPIEGGATAKADETIEGGAYIVNGVLVNCEGEPVEPQKTEPVEPPKK